MKGAFMKRELLAASIGFALSACAWSAEGLAEAEIEDVYYSDLDPDIIAGCISTRLMGANPMIRVDEGHYAVLRNNGYGIPIVRWDIIGSETGQTRVEFRRSMAIMSGEDKAQSCLTREGVDRDL